jgi:hypothetical protein
MSRCSQRRQRQSAHAKPSPAASPEAAAVDRTRDPRLASLTTQARSRSRSRRHPVLSPATGISPFEETHPLYARLAKTRQGNREFQRRGSPCFRVCSSDQGQAERSRAGQAIRWPDPHSSPLRCLPSCVEMPALRGQREHMACEAAPPLRRQPTRVDVTGYRWLCGRSVVATVCSGASVRGRGGGQGRGGAGWRWRAGGRTHAGGAAGAADEYADRGLAV